jgi:hypothetical protein
VRLQDEGPCLTTGFYAIAAFVSKRILVDSATAISGEVTRRVLKESVVRSPERTR